jgi:hypothetical protein
VLAYFDFGGGGGAPAVADDLLGVGVVEDDLLGEGGATT